MARVGRLGRMFRRSEVQCDNHVIVEDGLVPWLPSRRKLVLCVLARSCWTLSRNLLGYKRTRAMERGHFGQKMLSFQV